MLESRQALDVAEYEDVFQKGVPADGSSVSFDMKNDPAPIVMAGIAEHKRRYVVK